MMGCDAEITPYYQDDAVTIYHGDCRDILPTLGDIGAIVADPPYGISLPCDYAARGRGNLAGCRDYAPVAHDNEPFDPAHILAVNVPTILWGANYFSDKLPPRIRLASMGEASPRGHRPSGCRDGMDKLH